MTRPGLEVPEGTELDVLGAEGLEMFDLLRAMGHEQVVFSHDPSCGYHGIIAVHDTTLGPALGGTRFWDYESDREALLDVLRLSRGMTYKAAVAGLNLGGGKAVIIGDSRTRDREMLMRAHGRAIDSLGGRYITAEDMGVSVEDMDFVHMETDFVVGIQGRSGDPSPVTAYGVYRGIKACAHKCYGDDDLSARSVAVQGVGHVGHHLCRNLAEERVKLFITDIDEVRTARVADELGAEVVSAEEIYEVEADVFAPCALGAVVNDETIPKFRFDIIAGAANNQLAGSHHDVMLQEAGILYAPDYVINAGGLINVYSELAGWTLERSKRKAGEIYTVLLAIFDLAEAEGLTAAEAADRVAERRLERVGRLHRAPF
ncbi:MAG: Glu/Leu/Phe/Val dehydrogenase [Gemmatimonadota bacterium]|nr:Glu/Leu/Phe/Val dehydrogenase [Gemmatimonadota bacterium]